MRVASVMVGNSSSALIEAPSFKLIAVNIGIRQNGRLRAKNVIDVPHDKNAIKEAINKALHDKKFRGEVEKIKNPYGDGKASDRIAEILLNIEINEDLCQKQITY
jgi:UDP-N-acetylglucosamine 2-epimerase